MKKDSSIRSIGKNKCTGCMACIDYCPYDGLDLIIDEEGFYYPKVNEKCIECGACPISCGYGAVVESQTRETGKALY